MCIEGSIGPPIPWIARVSTAAALLLTQSVAIKCTYSTYYFWWRGSRMEVKRITLGDQGTAITDFLGLNGSSNEENSVKTCSDLTSLK